MLAAAACYLVADLLVALAASSWLPLLVIQSQICRLHWRQAVLQVHMCTISAVALGRIIRLCLKHPESADAAFM
jgi:hypothetical protein